MSFQFKREADVYLVSQGIQYKLDFSEITFSQELEDTLQDIKTIQTQAMFPEVIVNAFKPATFSITFPALREDDFQNIFARALDYQTFDLFISVNDTIYKINTGVITNLTFIIQKFRPLSLTLSGEASKLEEVSTLEGTEKARSSTRTYNKIDTLNVTLGGVDTLDFFTAVSIELQNQIKWNPYKTLSELCPDGNSVVYPTEFTLDKRILSGNLTSHRVDPITWDSDTSLNMEIGQNVGGTIYGFIFTLGNVSFTSRLNTKEIYTHSYDWRLTQNPESLAELIEYITDLTDESNAILDSWGVAILDSNNLPILDHT